MWGSLVLFFAFLQGWEGSVVLQYWKLDIGLIVPGKHGTTELCP